MQQRPKVKIIRPDKVIAPDFTDAIANNAYFHGETINGELRVEPAEGSGVINEYFKLSELCNSKTDLSNNQWAQPFLNNIQYSVDRKQYHKLLLPHINRLNNHPLPNIEHHIAQVKLSLAALQDDEIPEFLSRQLPEMFRIFPEGKLWSVSVEPKLMSRLAFLRTQMSLKFVPDLPINEMIDQKFNIMSAHSISAGVNFDSLINYLLLIFPFGSFGFVIPRQPTLLIFTFGHLEGIRAEFPRSLAALYETTLFGEENNTSKVLVNKMTSGLNANEKEQLLKWWISRINIIYSYIADPTQWSDSARRHSPAKQMSWFLTYERLLADGLATSTLVENGGLLRLQSAFDIIDKAEVLLGATKDDSGNIFRRLLCCSQTFPKIKRSYKSLPNKTEMRFTNYTEKLYETLYEEVRKSIHPKRLTKKGVKIYSDKKSKLIDVSTEQYVSGLIRAVRNSSHGLMEHLTGKEKAYLSMHDGEIPQTFALLASMLLFSLVSDPERLISQTWLS